MIAITSPEMLLPVLNKWRCKRQEHFIVCSFASSNKLIKASVIAIGTASNVIVHPREVFWQAIKCNATAIVVAHNHPGGTADPSCEDEIITNELCQASKIMKIPLLDHIIVTKDSYYSFYANGKIGKKC